MTTKFEVVLDVTTNDLNLPQFEEWLRSLNLPPAARVAIIRGPYRPKNRHDKSKTQGTVEV